jgi:hypothetical protein
LASRPASNPLTLEDFKKEISKRFATLSEKRLNITSRTLFLLKRKDAVG